MKFVSQFDFEGILDKNDNTRMFEVNGNLIGIYSDSSCVIIDYENLSLFATLKFKKPKTQAIVWRDN